MTKDELQAIAKAATTISKSVAMLARIEGMKAANIERQADGFTLAYDEAAFNEVEDQLMGHDESQIISEPVEYAKTMSLPLSFSVYARTENFEEYVMQIVAQSHDRAELAATALCDSLGLILDNVSEADDDET